MNAPVKKNGFTLVESLVTGVLLAVFAGGLFTFFRMHNLEASASTANFNLQMNANVVREQFSRDIHRANRILTPNEAWTQTITVMDSIDTDEIYLYDTTGAVFAAYRLEEGFLEEAHPDSPVYPFEESNYQVFTIGPHQVTAEESSSFSLTPSRQLAALNMELTIEKNGVSQSLRLAGAAFRCRN